VAGKEKSIRFMPSMRTASSYPKQGVLPYSFTTT